MLIRDWPRNAKTANAASSNAIRNGSKMAAEALANMSAVSMRTQWIDAGAVTIINDAYNANPASMRAAGEVLCGVAGRRRVMICGDMGELGSTSEALHEQLGGDLAGSDIDLLIGVGPLGRYIAQGAAAGGLKTETFESAAQAAENAPTLLRDGDVVLIKGSRATGMEALVGPIVSAFTSTGQCDA